MATKMVTTWRIDLEPIRARGIIVKYTVHVHPQSIQKCVEQNFPSCGLVCICQLSVYVI